MLDLAAQNFDEIGGTICLNMNGSITLSCVFNSHRIAKTYYGHSESEAVHDFMENLESE